MERRVLIAVFLSFLVLYAYQTFIVRPASVGQTAGVSGSAAVPPATSGSATTPLEPRPDAAVVRPAPAVAMAEVVKGDSTEREITVDTNTVQVVLTNRGGRVLHWRLKSYLDASGKPVDLIPSDIPSDQPTPFSLRVEDQAQLTRTLNDALYELVGGASDRVDATRTGTQLRFEFEDRSGLRVRKEFRFEPQGFVVRFSASVVAGEQALSPTIDWGPGLGDEGARAGGGSFFTGNYVQAPEAILHRDGSVQRTALTSFVEDGRPNGQFRFVGIDDHYFLVAALPGVPTQATYSALTLGDPDGVERKFATMGLRLASAPTDVPFFVGPKELDTLRAVDPELGRAINFGMFAWLVLPLLNGLKWLYRYVGNYGIAIILLTVLINLIIFPLRHKTVVSMRKMQALQPQLKAIQDRYAGLKVTDPARQKMNSEVMNLYKERGVNPASGCVPMLLTMPVLFAFYSLLSQAIELRGAPFALWIHDLSAHDPYYVTPLLMGASMFWQQKITPSAADPAQQRMMLFMPIIFTAMFLRFPSGLAIYYFTSNLWSIGQQYFTNWWIGPAAVAVQRPPAERRLKGAGSGKTADAERKN